VPHASNEGGQFIPYDTTAFNNVDRELLANVDRLVLLHDIVEQLPLRQPIAEAQMTGPFGKRIDPLNGRWAIHPGVDLAGPLGAHIFSASAGKVVNAGHKAAYGNMVDIDHGFGIVTRYAHMSRILVKEGDIVHKGQQIGFQGSTGRSTGPHLHYEVRINDRPVNPVKFLHAGEYVSEN
jgi:murein DD-endopeptidase MepM/ murein hydrolase activator NlpD